MCAFLSNIHTNEKLRQHDFNYYHQHHTIKYISAIALMNEKIKHYINFAMSPTLMSTSISGAVTLGVNPGLYAAPTTAKQVLHSLIFGDLLYSVTGKDDDNPKIM